MGKNAEPGAGAIYRYVDGTLHKLFGKMTIPNAICFAPDGSCAYYADTVKRKILRVALDEDGFPEGKPDLFVDLTAEGLNPDGAVVDAQGNFWIAQWGAGQVACYDANGTFQRAVSVPAAHVSCPAFGGRDLQTLFVVSATQHMTDPGPQDGKTFAIDLNITGQKEHQILL
jgi:sugar lactone lactonase YvrE